MAHLPVTGTCSHDRNLVAYVTIQKKNSYGSSYY